MAVVFHTVCLYFPNLVLSLLQGCHFGRVIFDQLRCILQEGQLHLLQGRNFLLIMFQMSVLHRFQLIDHVPFLLDVLVHCSHSLLVLFALVYL